MSHCIGDFTHDLGFGAGNVKVALAPGHPRLWRHRRIPVGGLRDDDGQGLDGIGERHGDLHGERITFGTGQPHRLVVAEVRWHVGRAERRTPAVEDLNRSTFRQRGPDGDENGNSILGDEGNRRAVLSVRIRRPREPWGEISLKAVRKRAVHADPLAFSRELARLLVLLIDTQRAEVDDQGSRFRGRVEGGGWRSFALLGDRTMLQGGVSERLRVFVGRMNDGGGEDGGETDQAFDG